MNGPGASLQLALRERRRAVLLLCLWVCLTLVCAVAGPFGTHDALGFAGRLAYWAVAVGISVASSTLLVLSRGDRGWMRVVVWAVYAIALSAVIYVPNGLVFDSWQSSGSFLYLLGYVAVTVLAVHVVLWLIDFARPVTAGPDGDAETRFLRRLPVARRGPLVRIEAQDHYLNVVTDKGSAFILMRLGEAVEVLKGTAGLQVHRSHWISIPAVQAHRRDKGRDILVMSDGAEVPVSRSNRAAAQEAGLI